MCVDCVLASPRITQVDSSRQTPPCGGSVTAGKLLRLTAHPCQTHPKDPDASSSSPTLVLPTTTAGAPLKPLGWAETSPLHGEHRPLHAPSPLDQRITLFSSSSGCRNPPRCPPVTTCLLRRRTPPPVFNCAASSTLGHLGEPRSSSPCRAPPSFTIDASLSYPAAFHPLPGHHRPRHGAARAHGDHAAGVHLGAGWHGPPRPIVTMGWAGR
jgi:hypothetical protein